MADARGALERDELLVEGMQSRVNALQTDVINRDDPAQQAQLRVQLQRAIDELARLQKTVDADRKAIETIQTEARRKGVPPGWIR
jgi:t-SNARE complex subunit (syntaxin)